MTWTKLRGIDFTKTDLGTVISPAQEITNIELRVPKQNVA
jgi:hypothetical protein